MKVVIASISTAEQETIINRLRSDKNKILVYSSDRRVINRIIFDSTLKGYIKKQHFDKEKRLVAISLEADLRIFRRGLFLPLWRGGQNE